MSPTLLAADDVKARIVERQSAERTEDVRSAGYRFVKPLTEAAEGLIEYAQNPHGRFMLGIHDVDAMTRGHGAGELVYVIGRSHSGKTQVILNALVHNRERNVIMFTPDEVAELVLAKLVSILHGVNGEALEERIKAGDGDALTMVRTTAARDFKNLIVIDEPLGFRQMTQAIQEARDYWGGYEDAIVVDFLELLSGDGEGSEGVQAKSENLKKWGKPLHGPTLCIHQSSRGAGKRGQAAGMGGMRYGGENDAICVLEVFRKREDPDLDEWERQAHENTVTVNVTKNKRPPAKKGMVDLFMNADTGRIEPLVDTRPAEPAAVASPPRRDWDEPPLPDDPEGWI